MSNIVECPKCKGEIIEDEKRWGCKNWRDDDGGCKFVVWKEIAGHTVTQEEFESLVSGEKIGPFKLRGKNGKEFEASFYLDDEFVVKFEFKDSSYEIVGKCPLCNGDIVETQKAYGCKNWREEDGGCKFVIWKNISGYEVAVEDAQKLLSGEEIGPFDFKSKNGKDYKASLYLNDEGKLERKFI